MADIIDISVAVPSARFKVLDRDDKCPSNISVQLIFARTLSRHCGGGQENRRFSPGEGRKKSLGTQQKCSTYFCWVPKRRGCRHKRIEVWPNLMVMPPRRSF